MAANSKRRYLLQFKHIGNTFRTLALCLAIFLFSSSSISRSSHCFSAVFKFLGLFLYRLSIVILNHHFVFLLGNAIIVTLFVKFACDNSRSSGDSEYLIADALLQPAVPDGSEIINIPAETEINLVAPESTDCPISRREVTDQDVDDPRRSATGEPRRETENSEKERLDVDDLSNEEFQREVEAFIERQRRFLREESLAAVSP